MAIPSGSGSEVLKRSYIDGLTTSGQTLITGVQHHIYTVLSIIVTNRSAGSLNLDMWIDYNAGGTDLYLIDTMPVPAKSAFTWNDKIVLTGTDKLEIYFSGASADVWCSYIDQDWT